MTLVLAQAAHAEKYVPSIFWVWPFIAILLSIAILPLLRKTHHWWEANKNKLLIALILAVITMLYYGFRGQGVEVHAKNDQAAAPAGHQATPDASAHGSEPVELTAAEPKAEHAETEHEGPQIEAAHSEKHYSDTGFATVMAVLDHAVFKEYVPFIVLLFSLYVIAGGLVVRGDIQATPMANTCIVGMGGVLASFIGTTGSAMLLIRFLLKTNSERKHKVHTVIFFIFIAANIGGTLLPIGDPPLFLGYLRGVPFFWTLGLWRYWLIMLAFLLVIYFAWDSWAYKHEAPEDIRLDETRIQPMRVAGLINLIWLVGVVAAVATLDPSKPVPGTTWRPVIHVGGFEFTYIRECVQLLMALFSWLTTSMALRKENQFNFVAIGEVACLFIGIFITMQVPIEILRARGAELGLSDPWHFFWATGILSSFLDNAPTYVVYFETASALPATGMPLMTGLATGSIAIPLLMAVSCGAVFMGANTYIGNGPNFMVKAIAEQSGVKMPSFFGYMLYSGLILIPVFVVLTLIFFR
jgi:Na+/H+ antiporter NhaD/arsenite permease-like protein